MRFAKKLLGVFLFIIPLFLTNTINAFETDDDYTPQVTARVARITFLNGDVQIKRNGVESWEKATNNLPLAEGDELTTSSDARLEIEFDNHNHLRLANNSYLKITTLRDGGIAVSLPQGTLNLRVSQFEKDNEFFEIDAPKTTLAVQKEGMYRIDAGDASSSEIRLTTTEKGEARIYSGNSGFTLKNGRSARLFLSGNFEGEWETGDASRYVDEFDTWSLDRDAAIAKRQRDSYVDKYYDSEITGADELNEYGQWIYTRKYGYVWKPYSSSVSSYSNWSPYRYGHWRWFPPYGWTWVNDESWGWATYHYGRWVWDNNNWYWSPYGRNRWRRSWWSPALVVVTYSGGYYCWYPLPYHYNYYNYNAYYYNNNTTIINNNTTIINNNSTTRQDGIKQNPAVDVPPNAVVGANANEFGKIVKGFQNPPWQVSQNVLANQTIKTPTTPILPNYDQLDAQTTKSVAVATPNIVKSQTPIKTGVIVRETGISMSDKIQKQKVLDDRTNTSVKTNPTTTNNTVRDTGSVTRDQQTVRQTQTNTQNQTDRNTTRTQVQTNNDNTNIRSTGGGNSNQTDRNTTRNNSNNQQQQQTDRNTQRNQQQQQTDRNTQRNQQQQQQQNQTQRNQPRNDSQPTQRSQPQQQQQPQKQQPQKQPQEQPQQKQQPQKQVQKSEQDRDG